MAFLLALPKVIFMNEFFIIFNKKFNSYETNSNKKDLRCGLGEMKSYYCKGDYIWLNENRNVTSKSRQEFKKELL